MEILYILLVLLFVTRLMGELATRIRQPPLVGELIGGILLGIVATYYSESLPVLDQISDDPVFIAITDLGIFFLMLLAGIEMHPRELANVSGKASVVAFSGMIIPLAGGLALGWLFVPASDYKLAQTLFLATALAITAVPVVVRVLMDIGRLDSRFGQVIVSAAIFDDVMSLVLLAVLTGVIETGSIPDWTTLGILAGKIVIFFGVTAAIGHWVFPWVGQRIRRFQADEFDFSAILMTGLLFAVIAEVLGLHFIVGAFMVGLFFGRQTVGDQVYDAVRAKVSGMTTGFLGPVFFASIGLHLTLGAVTAAPLFLVALVVMAILTKVLGSGIAAYWAGLDRTEALGVGFGMSARGAVELIIADIALRAGLFDLPDPTPPVVQSLFSSVVIMAILTTLLAPVLLRITISRANEGSESPRKKES